MTTTFKTDTPQIAPATLARIRAAAHRYVLAGGSLFPNPHDGDRDEHIGNIDAELHRSHSADHFSEALNAHVKDFTTRETILCQRMGGHRPSRGCWIPVRRLRGSGVCRADRDIQAGPDAAEDHERRPAMKRLLQFRLPDPRRVRALCDEPPAATDGRVGTRAALVQAGLTGDEIRLLGGFRGLDAQQQAALILVAESVVARARGERP